MRAQFNNARVTMLMLRCGNLMIIVAAGMLLWRGLGVAWTLSTVPMILAIIGACIGMVSVRSTLLAETVLMLSASGALFVGGMIATGGLWLMLPGGSEEQIQRMSQDAYALFAIACACVACGIASLYISFKRRRRLS